jgi:F-type H+-transporting ATPase subunit delta
MPNPRLAARYAKSLLDMAIEKNALDEVNNDVRYLSAVCKNSKEFVNLMKSPIITSDKKQAVLDAVCKDKVSVITHSFNKLLVAKGRESVVPEIVTAFIEQYNTLKGIHKVKLTTAQPLTAETAEGLMAKLRNETALKNLEIETKVDEALIGGFVLEFNNNIVDASIQRDLKDIQKQFLKNDYIFNIR